MDAESCTYEDVAAALRVPKRKRSVFAEIMDLVDSFCRRCLNEEYSDVCRRMTAALCRTRTKLGRTRLEAWASGIVHAVGWVNFLFDPHQKPHIEARDIATAFGVSQSSMTARSRAIRDKLRLIQLDPDWCVSSLMEDNPFVWVFTVDGLLMDMRVAPRQVQEQAYEMGIIPYIPDDESSEGPQIIEFPGNNQQRSEPQRFAETPDNGAGLFDNLEQ